MLRAMQRVVSTAVLTRSCHQGRGHVSSFIDVGLAVPSPTLVPWTLYPISTALLLKNLEISEPKSIIGSSSRGTMIPPGLGISKEYDGRAADTVGREVEDPLSVWRSAVEEAPAVVIEKQAARLIVIRRSKMNKHKLRKLRKKMKFVWAKVRQRRGIRKERAYLNSKMALIEAARKFDAKEFVASVIKKAKEEPIPRKWQDPLMPQWYKDQEMLKEIKSKRYQKQLDLHLNHKITIDNK